MHMESLRRDGTSIEFEITDAHESLRRDTSIDEITMGMESLRMGTSIEFEITDAHGILTKETVKGKTDRTGNST